jgi:hypothetical protein
VTTLDLRDDRVTTLDLRDDRVTTLDCDDRVTTLDLRDGDGHLGGLDFAVEIGNVCG